MVVKWIKHKIRAIRDGAAMDRELDAEVRFHIEMEKQKDVTQAWHPPVREPMPNAALVR